MVDMFLCRLRLARPGPILYSRFNVARLLSIAGHAMNDSSLTQASPCPLSVVEVSCSSLSCARVSVPSQSRRELG